MNHNPQIDTILLGFSNHNIHASIDSIWFFNERHIKSRYKLYFPLLDFEDIYTLVNHHPASFITTMFTQVLTPAQTLKGRSAYGGHSKLKISQLESEKDKYMKQGRLEFSDQNISLLEIEYLTKIIHFCSTQNITIILVNTPLHPFLNNKSQILDQLHKQQFPEVTFWNYGDLKYSDEHFGDLVHLNTYETMAFTNYFIQKL